MPYRNKQITIRLPKQLALEIQNLAWDNRISRNRVIENILLKHFEIPAKISSEMAEIIWGKLNSFESKIEDIRKLLLGNTSKK